MGLFGGGNSKKTTVNEDNRVINDYSGSQMDLSSDTDNSVDNSIYGQYAGNQGEINVLDGGAIDAVEGVGYAMADLAGVAMAEQAAVTQTALNYGESLFADATGVIDNSGERMLDAALAVHDSALSQIDMGNDLALNLARVGADQTADTNDALTGGFGSMMQFIEDYSRSDGASLAETNMKTVGVLAVAMVAAVYLMNR